MGIVVYLISLYLLNANGTIAPESYLFSVWCFTIVGVIVDIIFSSFKSLE
jgi:hypothetical protein